MIANAVLENHANQDHRFFCRGKGDRGAAARANRIADKLVGKFRRIRLVCHGVVKGQGAGGGVTVVLLMPGVMPEHVNFIILIDQHLIHIVPCCVGMVTD